MSASGRKRTLESVQIAVSKRSAFGRVEMWRGGNRSGLSVSAPFVWRCPSDLTLTPFPHPAHRTGHADFPHPALGQDTYLRTRKVIRSSPTHRTELCDSSVNQASVLFATANATAWEVIRCPDHDPDSSFASACGTFRSSRTLAEFLGLPQSPVLCNF